MGIYVRMKIKNAFDGAGFSEEKMRQIDLLTQGCMPEQELTHIDYSDALRHTVEALERCTRRNEELSQDLSHANARIAVLEKEIWYALMMRS